MSLRDGWVDSAERRLSPNQDERPEGQAIDMVVVHAISLPPGEFGGPWIDDLFQNKLNPDAHPYFAGIAALRVSAHFLIRRNGVLIQYVPCDRRAWHAGASFWDGRERCNDFSIGIELEGCDEQPFAEVQYERLNQLLAELRAQFPVRHVVGHSDIAPQRKTDPGPCFDWARIFAE